MPDNSYGSPDQIGKNQKHITIVTNDVKADISNGDMSDNDANFIGWNCYDGVEYALPFSMNKSKNLNEAQPRPLRGH